MEFCAQYHLSIQQLRQILNEKELRQNEIQQANHIKPKRAQGMDFSKLIEVR